ncbi:hypothetical protein P43SY_001703 [Pythium insidiosum]|uniref:Transmembrane protein n=1 Tax=Pythium insidiosum TaxID=114742 RepID=A0AAD5M108_PYTIN|nr:hypothetical protein P43SY_001703 [Pythium insidiosum]
MTAKLVSTAHVHRSLDPVNAVATHQAHTFAQAFAHGLTFHALRQQSVYLATLSASMAVCNITVSALVYLRTEL